jgi:hypothetical protein
LFRLAFSIPSIPSKIPASGFPHQIADPLLSVGVLIGRNPGTTVELKHCGLALAAGVIENESERVGVTLNASDLEATHQEEGG